MQCVTKVIKQLIRNKMRKVCKDCSRTQTEGGTFPASSAHKGSPCWRNSCVMLGGDLSLPQCSLLAAGTQPTALGQRVWKERVKLKDKPKEHFCSPFFTEWACLLENPALGCGN